MDNGLRPPVRDRVAVVGAGWAGLSAAVNLSGRGVPVIVYEASRTLGGRARRLSIEGLEVDNGQHILIGAYRETLAMMRKVGVDPDKTLARLPLDIRYADGFRLRAAWLPHPMNLLAALFTASGVSFAEALAAALFMRRVRADRPSEDRTVARWLDDHGQSGTLRSHLWEPLCVSALNTPPCRASAQVFACVLRDGLAGSSHSSDLLLARADLGTIFPEPAARFVRSRGGTIELGRPVRRIASDGSDFRVDGESFSAVVVACGPQHAATLLRDFPQLSGERTLIEALEYEPIVTCYLKYPESVSLPAPMIGFNGGTVQWVFDRGQLGSEKGLLAAVISASGAHEALSHGELTARIEAELRASWGSLPALEWSRVIAEKRATFSCRASLARPQGRTAVPGLVLAGDYVASDYPGTLESAVRSGVAAAACVQTPASAFASR